MRIYLAGLYHARGAASETSGTEHMRIAHRAREKYPWDLESYFYMQNNWRIIEQMRKDKRTIFMDSGAFSMYTQKVDVSIEAYAKFLLDNKDIWHVASNLDDVFKNEAKSWENQKTMESLGVKVQPVFHCREDERWLVKYLDAGYDYIFLGGMVPESTPWLKGWLDRLWTHYLTNKDGTARIKVHGFGLTTLQLMFRYPWFSVDSTSWVMTSSYGGCFVDMPEPGGGMRDYKVNFSTDSGRVRDLDQHYDTLPKATQERIRKRVEELGYTVQGLRESYGWRDHFNIGYFKRAMERRIDRFTAAQPSIFDMVGGAHVVANRGGHAVRQRPSPDKIGPVAGNQGHGQRLLPNPAGRAAGRAAPASVRDRPGKKR